MQKEGGTGEEERGWGGQQSFASASLSASLPLCPCVHPSTKNSIACISRNDSRNGRGPARVWGAHTRCDPSWYVRSVVKQMQEELLEAVLEGGVLRARLLSHPLPNANSCFLFLALSCFCTAFYCFLLPCFLFHALSLSPSFLV